MMLEPQNPAAPAGSGSRALPRAFLASLLISALMLAPQPVQAQSGTSVLQGGVTDAVTRAPVSEALITVTSPALQGEQTVLTDASGYYRLPTLPPGVYTVRVDREGYESYEQTRINMRGDVTFRVNVFLVPRRVEGKAEEIEITERPPTIDVGSSSVSTTFSEEMLRRVPLSRPTGRGGAVRSYESVAASAAQAREDTYGPGIAGTTSPENRYIINGLPVNDAAFGTGTTPFSSEFVKEITVISGGYLPEYGRATGGIITATVKTGSNEIRGSAWTNVTPGFLEGTPETVFREGSTIVAGRPQVNVIGDFGTDVGLPLVKDRLWLYLGVLGGTVRHKLPRSLWENQVDAAGMPVRGPDGRTARAEIPGTATEYDSVSNSLQAVSNLSFSPSRNHSLTLTTIVAPWRAGGGGDYGYGLRTGAPQNGGTALSGGLLGPYEAIARVSKNDQLSNVLKWTATTPGKKVTFDNTIGWHRSSESSLPSDGSLPGSRQGLAATSGWIWRRAMPHSIRDFEQVPDGYCDPAGTANAVRCPVTLYNTESVGNISVRDQDRLQLRSMMTVLAQALGHHVIKVGVDIERVSNNLLKAYPGGNLYRENTAGTSFADYRNYGYLVGPDEVIFADSVRANVFQWGIGAFAQNSWSIADKVTLNVGLRYDSQRIYNNEGDMRMALPNQISPRLGLIYDPTQSGRAKLFASFARYYQQVPLDVADRALSAEPGVAGNHDAMLCNPTDPAKRAACRELSTYRRSGQSYSPDQLYVGVGGGTTPIDPDLKTPQVDEYMLGAEYQLIPDSRLALTVSRRRLKNMIEDMSVDEAQTYFIGNPGAGIAANFPEARREYDSMMLLFQKEFANDWLAQASYTLMRLQGNIAGLFRPETGQLDPNINSDFDLLSLLPNRTGPLDGDNRHTFGLAGAYNLGLGQRHNLNFGAGVRAVSGAPTSYLGSHGVYGPGEVFVLPRGSGERLPWFYSGDVNVRYGLTLPNGHELLASINVYNLLNLQRITARDETYTQADVTPVRNGTTADLSKVTTTDGMPLNPMDVNPNFRQPTAYQAPRIVTFGLRYNY